LHVAASPVLARQQRRAVKVENGEMTGVDVRDQYGYALYGDRHVVAVLHAEEVELGRPDLGVRSVAVRCVAGRSDLISGTEEDKAFMLGEVSEVFDVQVARGRS
jgi:hypothetical protein